MLADNSHHLAVAAQRRHDDAHQRAEDAIRVAAARGEAVPVVTLAARAGVSRAFLYANLDLIEAIRQLRSNGEPVDAIPARQRATEASLLRPSTNATRTCAARTTTCGDASKLLTANYAPRTR